MTFSAFFRIALARVKSEIDLPDVWPYGVFAVDVDEALIQYGDLAIIVQEAGDQVEAIYRTCLAEKRYTVPRTAEFAKELGHVIAAELGTHDAVREDGRRREQRREQRDSPARRADGGRAATGVMRGRAPRQAERSSYYGAVIAPPPPPPSVQSAARGRHAETAFERETRGADRTTTPAPKSRSRAARKGVRR